MVLGWGCRSSGFAPKVAYNGYVVRLYELVAVSVTLGMWGCVGAVVGLIP